MAKIPALVWVIAGAILVGGSLYVGEQFQLFLYIGIGFLAFGAVVGFIGALSFRNAQKTLEKRQQQTAAELSKKYPGFLPSQNVKTCMRCKLQYPLHAHFCSRCGTRI